MRRSPSSVVANLPFAFRRATAAIAAVVLLAALLGVTCDAHGAERTGIAGVVETSHDPAGVPVVARSNRPAPVVTQSRPMRQRHVGLDGLALVAAAFAVVGVFRRYAKPGAAQRLCFDAIFALRRGPPSLRVAL